MNRNTAQSYTSLSEFAPDWVATPGDSIADLLEERGWTQAELALRTGFTRKHINQLVKGEAPITEDTALKLEKVLGSSARFWLALEAQYREQLGRKEEMSRLGAEVGWLDELPLADMIRFKWIKKAREKAHQVDECLRYFAVSSVSAWRAQYEQPVAAYRAAATLRRTPAAVSVWLREGERRAAMLECEDFDQEKFEAALVVARSLTRERKPTEFLPRLSDVCRQAGVAVVVAPAPKGCPVNGATKWLSPTRALILLSVRGRSDDKLWFTFFHEAAHLLKHGKRLTFLDILGEDGLSDDEEQEANAFARDFLLPMADYKKFVKDVIFSVSRVRSFADQQGVSAGVVVGRLQFDRFLPWTHLNGLKVQYVWKQNE
ncbi:MAG: HigA family addiction module antitoxin [Pseudomonadota bacterium]|nr:HigA family addiction module antitoxin [Pseudomonadota bacterium]